MSTYVVGNTIPFGLTVKSSAGVLADLGGGNPTATVTLPDGTTASASVAKSSTGLYVASIAATQAGRHRVVWTGSGTNSGDLPYVDHADVWPVDWRPIIPLATARQVLNVGDSLTDDDDELLGYLVSARIVVEHICGPILSAEVTRTVTGNGRQAIALPSVPVSVTEVTEDGQTLTEGSDFCWDENGLLWRGSQPGAATWSTASTRNVSVTYEVGDTAIPQNIIQAASYLVRHWWGQTQQGARPIMGGTYGLEEQGGYVVAGYAIPHMVNELLVASVQGPRRAGFA